MKQVIPFVKEIVFKNNIASITSISLEHEEKIFDGEVSGDFIVFGDYKVHSDTTEKELFKYRLPFSALLPDNIDFETVKVDIEDFTYDVIDRDVIKVNIDFLITADNKKDKIENGETETNRNEDDEELDRKIDELLGKNDIKNIADDCQDVVIEDNAEESSMAFKASDEGEEKVIDASDKFFYERDDDSLKIGDVVDSNGVVGNINVEGENTVMNDSNNDYVTYHIHIVNENETLEDILKMYNTNIDNIKIYNEITNINVGDKIIIPDNIDE